MSVTGSTMEKPKVSPLYDPRIRSIAYQLLLCGIIIFLVWSAISNAAENLQKARIASGFDFWYNTAGFDISQSLIEYSTVSTYGRAFWVGLLNTLLVAVIGIVLATILGFIVGIMRLSKNFVVSKVAGAFVELVRNLPLLLQLLFWYNAVLKALPEMRDSLTFPGGGFLNNRGLFIAQPIPLNGFSAVWIALGLGVIGSIGYRIWAKKRQEKTG
jgi:general L-amino acid transport system permease protein